MTKSSTKSFENQLEQLESIVKSMEEGDLPLDDALKKFEKGIQLTQQCQQLLNNAQQKVQSLTDENTLIDVQTESESE